MMAKSPVHHYNGTNVSNGRASQSSVPPPTLPHTVKLFVGKACTGRPRYGPSGPPREEVSRRLWRVLVLALTVPASSRTSSALLPANFIAAPSWLFWMLVTATFWPTSRREQVMGHFVRHRGWGFVTIRRSGTRIKENLAWQPHNLSCQLDEVLACLLEDECSHGKI